MKFEVDSQTLKDLEIFDTVKNRQSIFDIFNQTKTLGGKTKLQDYLSLPLCDYNEINERKEAIAFIQSFELIDELDIDKNSLDFIEHYLNQGNYPTKPPSRFFAIEKGLINKLNPSNEYYLVERGIEYTIELMNNLYRFSKVLKNTDCPPLIKKNIEEVFRLFSLEEYSAISEKEDLEKNKFYDIAKFDYMFRYTHKNQVYFFLDLIYEFDVFISVAKVAAKYNFSYPNLNKDNTGISIKGLFHPFIKNAVRNDIEFNSSKNHFFISGPNMAGKSTFLKSLGIAVYLAHCGFPVAATKMSIDTLSGLYTTINLTDSLNSGYSHFYSEVARIKLVATRLKEKRMLVIFDELFRGTNVKDAYDGTLAVITAFSKVKNSFFAISSHIIEAAYKLVDITNIGFGYFEIVSEDKKPKYTYKLKEGISEERLGMYILQQEKVIDTINEINN